MSINLEQILPMLSLIVVSIPAVFVYTQIAKISNKLPWLQEGMVVKIRAFSAVLSALSVLLLGWSSGAMTPESIQGVIESIIAFAAIWGGSHVLYESQKK